MIMTVGVRGLRMAFTRNLGAWVGRTIPVVGEVFLAVDASMIMLNTVRVYNAIAKPEDRVF
ncbi:hypothetical protein WL77_26545 [Burkholderia ubonensis]|nr:hypothetical protein WL77_26545 [Burkholderia ubonensis]KWE78069.1 hypothetical protein WL79_06005 [Burkholderia ubonensis]